MTLQMEKLAWTTMALQPDPDAVSRALWHVTRATQDANLAFAGRLALGRSDVAALELLMNEGPLGPAELGARLGMRSASATALVDRLEAAGHVERVRDPDDRRRITVVPTDHARREAGAAIGPLLAEFHAAAARLSPQEREVVVGYLEEVAAALRDYAAGT
jgi:DNA-binding MarR family transcriptional regulator